MEIIGLYIVIAAVLALQAATIFKLRTTQRPDTPAAKGSAEQSSIVVDTCALIDGRIQDLVKAGFVTQRLYVARRVIEELQYLADHGDAHKRARARFGLDVVQSLQEAAPEQVTIIENVQQDIPVDDALVKLALQYNAALYTTDYNLNKVARIHGVHVLNVNELAHALRPIHLPGEKVTVKIVQKGESHTQGVGYLEDGTMTVVEGASKRMGAHVTADVDRMLQTEAGKMVFATLAGHTNEGQQQKRPRRHQQQAPQASRKY